MPHNSNSKSTLDLFAPVQHIASRVKHHAAHGIPLHTVMRSSSLGLSLVRSFSLAPLAIASFSGSADSNNLFPLSQQQQYQQQQQQRDSLVGVHQHLREQRKLYQNHDPEIHFHNYAADMESVNTRGAEETVTNDQGDVGMSVEDKIPQRYVVGCQGDMAEASRRWQATCKWREENDVDDIIHRPQPRFDDSRRVFPAFVHGRSRKGLPVLWEQIGKVNTSLADELKLPLSQILPNYVFLNECIWRVILDKGEDDNDDAKFITVEDVAGVRIWHLTPKVLSTVRLLTGTMKEHYVERCYKSYIINAPAAFMALWGVISPMLDPRTRKKITIVGTNYAAALQEEIDPSQLPTEYGGTSGRLIHDSDDERKIQALVARLNSGGVGESNSGDPAGVGASGTHS